MCAFYYYGPRFLYFSLVIGTFSDRLPQFAIIHNSLGTHLTRSAICLKNISRTLKENFLLEYFSIDKDKVLEIDHEKIDYST